MGLEAIVVVDNVACGPAIGGIRMAPDVTLEEVARKVPVIDLTPEELHQKLPKGLKPRQHI